jgi:hypothetical protein
VKRLIGIARKNGGHGIEDQRLVNPFSPLWVCQASSHQTWCRRIGWRERSYPQVWQLVCFRWLAPRPYISRLASCKLKWETRVGLVVASRSTDININLPSTRSPGELDASVCNMQALHTTAVVMYIIGFSLHLLYSWLNNVGAPGKENHNMLIFLPPRPLSV